MARAAGCAAALRRGIQRRAVTAPRSCSGLQTGVRPRQARAGAPSHGCSQFPDSLRDTSLDQLAEPAHAGCSLAAPMPDQPGQPRRHVHRQRAERQAMGLGEHAAHQFRQAGQARRALDEVGQRGEARRPQSNVARLLQPGQHSVDLALKHAVEGDDHLLGLQVVLQRQRRCAGRPPRGVIDATVALLEQQLVLVPVAEVGEDREAQVDGAVVQGRADVGVIDRPHDQPCARRESRQLACNQGQEDDLVVVGQAQAEGFLGLSRLECRHRAGQRLDLRQRLIHGRMQGLRARGGHHAAACLHEQRIVEQFSQATQGGADGGLAQAQLFGRQRHAAMSHQCGEHHQQVEVERREVTNAVRTQQGG